MKKKKRKTHLIYLNVEKLRSSASMKRSTKKEKKKKRKKERRNRAKQWTMETPFRQKPKKK